MPPTAVMANAIKIRTIGSKPNIAPSLANPRRNIAAIGLLKF
jgi:hypothetical protein